MLPTDLDNANLNYGDYVKGLLPKLYIFAVYGLCILETAMTVEKS